jgi:hypothetical protein
MTSDNSVSVSVTVLRTMEGVCDDIGVGEQGAVEGAHTNWHRRKTTQAAAD